MMDIANLVFSDEALELIDSGTWVSAGEKAPDVEFLVTGLQADGAQKLIRKKQIEARTKNRGKPLSDEQQAQLTKEVLAEFVLRDWRGLKNNGNELPYSKELATKWITTRAGDKEFTNMVLSAAQKLDEMANEFVEEVAKN